MDNSVYIMLSRQTAVFRKMDTVANNIANVNTVGYANENMLFTDYLVDDGNRNNMAFTQDIASYHEERPGAMRVTGNPMDVAISGEGYFMLEMPGGNRAYTRAGNFQIDGNGVMVTQDGIPVLDEGGQRIEFAPEDKDVSIGENGVIVVNGEERALLGMVEFANRQNMSHISASMFDAGDQVPLPPENSRMLHGVLEESNVVAVQELVKMTETSRDVTNTAKFIEVIYDLQRKADNVYTQQS